LLLLNSALTRFGLLGGFACPVISLLSFVPRSVDFVVASQRAGFVEGFLRFPVFRLGPGLGFPAIRFV
jgi:hypothetical protein